MTSNGHFTYGSKPTQISVHIKRHVAYCVARYTEQLGHCLHGNSCLHHVPCAGNAKVHQSNATGIPKPSSARLELEDRSRIRPRRNLIAWSNAPANSPVLVQSQRYLIRKRNYAGPLTSNLYRFLSAAPGDDVTPSKSLEFASLQTRSVDHCKGCIVGKRSDILAFERHEGKALLLRGPKPLAYGRLPFRVPVMPGWQPTFSYDPGVRKRLQNVGMWTIARRSKSED